MLREGITEVRTVLMDPITVDTAVPTTVRVIEAIHIPDTTIQAIVIIRLTAILTLAVIEVAPKKWTSGLVGSMISKSTNETKTQNIHRRDKIQDRP